MPRQKVREMDLEAQLKASLKNAAPSMVPAPQLPDDLKPKHKKKDEYPNIQDVIDDPAKRLSLMRLMETDAAYLAEQSRISKTRKPITEEIKGLLPGITKFQAGENKLNYYKQSYEIIERTLLFQNLMAARIPLDTAKRIIKESIVLKEKWVLKVWGPKAGSDEGEDNE
jgi:hypothetical protein